MEIGVDEKADLPFIRGPKLMVLSRAPCTSSIRRRPARYRTDERISDWLIQQNLTENKHMSTGLVRISYQTFRISTQEQRCVLCNSYLHLTREIWGKATFWKGGIFFKLFYSTSSYVLHSFYIPTTTTVVLTDSHSLSLHQSVCLKPPRRVKHVCLAAFLPLVPKQNC